MRVIHDQDQAAGFWELLQLLVQGRVVMADEAHVPGSLSAADAARELERKATLAATRRRRYQERAPAGRDRIDQLRLSRLTADMRAAVIDQRPSRSLLEKTAVVRLPPGQCLRSGLAAQAIAQLRRELRSPRPRIQALQETNVALPLQSFPLSKAMISEPRGVSLEPVANQWRCTGSRPDWSRGARDARDERRMGLAQRFRRASSRLSAAIRARSSTFSAEELSQRLPR